MFCGGVPQEVTEVMIDVMYNTVYILGTDLECRIACFLNI